MVTGSKLTGHTALCLSARHFFISLVLFQPRKTGLCPNMTKKYIFSIKKNNVYSFKRQNMRLPGVQKCQAEH